MHLVVVFDYLVFLDALVDPTEVNNLAVMLVYQVALA